MKHVVHVHASASSRLAQRFEGDIEPDLVPVLEEIGDGLGDGEDPDGGALDFMMLDAVGQRRARKADDPQWWETWRGLARPWIDREPDFPGILYGETVEYERR